MSWGELMLIGGVALVVIPPKDLPKALRTLGQVTGKVRRMAGEFQSQFQDAIREAELDSVRKDLESINRNVTAATSTGFNPIETIRSELKGAVEGSSAPAGTAPVALATPEIVPSSPEIAVSEEAAEQAVAHGEAAELMPAEEAGAPPAIVTAPHDPQRAPPPPTVPMEMTGPGLESLPSTEASGLGLTGGSRA